MRFYQQYVVVNKKHGYNCTAEWFLIGSQQCNVMVCITAGEVYAKLT
jgi:hypothetical protein